MLIADKTASGWVTFTNLTASEVKIPAGTMIQTDSSMPVRFQTQRDLVLSGKIGSQGDALIEAIAAGTSGNVSAGAIKVVGGSLGFTVSVENQRALSGGHETPGRVISAIDIANAREQLLEKMKGNAQKEIKTGLASGEKILDASFQAGKVLSETVSPAAGQPGDELTLNLRVEFQAWTVRQADIESAVLTGLDANIPQGFTTNPGSYTLKETGATIMREGSANWKILATRQLVAGWDERILLQAVAGKEVTQAAQRVKAVLPLREEPVIMMEPAWWPLVPTLPSHIQVVVR
jgi:hypothetical protein